MAKIELSILSRQCTNRRISNKKTLAAKVVAREKDRNHVKVQIHWQFKPDNARIKLKRLYPVAIVKNSGSRVLAGYLRDIEWQDGNSFDILQGEEMGCPSRLSVHYTMNKGEGVEVSGETHHILKTNS